MKADASIGNAERNQILRLARGDAVPVAENNNGHASRIYSRQQAAEMLGGKTTRFVDLLVRKGCLVKKFVPGGRRAIGVTSSSLESFISGI